MTALFCLFVERIQNELNQTNSLLLVHKKRACNGFTLVEVLLVVVIVVVIGFLVLLVIDPQETTRRGRDAIRMNDIGLVFKAVQVAIDTNGEPSPALLCFEIPTPCSGGSLDQDVNVRKNDGTGWVKVDLAHAAGVNLPTLPADPLTTGPMQYQYYSDGYLFEVNAQFESKQYADRMKLDGGDNDQRFELGTKLTLIP